MALSDVRFQALWSNLGARGDGRDAFLVLREAYDEPQRAYHDARHIAACLRLFDDPEVTKLATYPAEVEAALFYHDAIYDTHARDNEEKSAALAERTLSAAGVLPAIVARIAAHVRATKDHTTTTDDGKLVIDIDLSILGESAETFARFEEDIRREYAWVEPAAYVAGRAAVLRKFIERTSIYNTPLFRDRYETKARANIAASLAKLHHV
jgi:predicted metal-dependent HD superfamily phosphohydrolase